MKPGFALLPTLAWYWNRLRCMSPAEIIHRLGRAVKSRIERYGFGTAHTVPKPNFSARFKYFLLGGDGIPPDAYSTAADAILAGKLSVFALDYVTGPIPRWNVDPKSGREAPLVFGKSLDYRDEALVGDVKYLWEPNRHLHLVTLAQAWRLTQERRYLDGLKSQLDSWLDQCPYPMGPNWTSSLELAIRLINWSIAWQLIGGAGSTMFAESEGARFRERWLRSIYQHMHFIRSYFSRHSSANNHLIGELSGLFVACVTWPFWAETARWRQVAKAGLEREVLLQNAADGVNREQAISYQQFVLDFLLLAALAGRENGDSFSEPYRRRIETMLEFIASVMDVNGNVPMIGDADDGYAVRLSQEAEFCPYRSLLATSAVLFNRGDFRAKAGQLDDKTRWLLGSASDKAFSNILANASALPVRREFREGGYYILGCEFETPREVRMIADAGPLGYLSIAAHGHADALALTLSVGGREFLVDPGTYAYHMQREWRDYFRGSGAHNTVVVDGENQSIIGGNFMWLRHANVKRETWEAGEKKDRFVGSHDGYTRLPDSVIHRRTIVLEKAIRVFEIEDALICRDSHMVERAWHFSESCAVSVAKDGLISAVNEERHIRLVPGESSIEIVVRHGETVPIGGWISRRFDAKMETTTVVWKMRISGTQHLRTRIEVHDS